jgi:hypothetical protein
MNLPALVMHGICALSVWSDVIVARLFLVVAGLITLTMGLLAGVVIARVSSVTLVPGWAAGATGILVVVMLLLGVMCLLMALFVLGSRTAANFLPHRDWRDYVLPPGTARGRRWRRAARWLSSTSEKRGWHRSKFPGRGPASPFSSALSTSPADQRRILE